MTEQPDEKNRPSMFTVAMAVRVLVEAPSAENARIVAEQSTWHWRDWAVDADVDPVVRHCPEGVL